MQLKRRRGKSKQKQNFWQAKFNSPAKFYIQNFILRRGKNTKNIERGVLKLKLSWLIALLCLYVCDAQESIVYQLRYTKHKEQPPLFRGSVLRVEFVAGTYHPQRSCPDMFSASWVPEMPLGIFQDSYLI